MPMKAITFRLNGSGVSAAVMSNTTLVELLRDEFQLTGTKIGCGVGECGACTVILDGKAVSSCLILACELDGRDVVTIEGLSDKGVLDPIQSAFVEKGAIQCGYCTPGMVMMAKALLDENRVQTEESVRKGISGNICRCTGYQKIVKAILSVCEEKQE
jgi:aerobic-type carbon monoxide dehydrogenase small subunit (CoxS/CutS family)